MMIKAAHLWWIVPGSMFLGAVVLIVVAAIVCKSMND